MFQYGALAYIEVPLSVLLGVLVLGESFVLNQLMGAIMVVTASLLAQKLRSTKPGMVVTAPGMTNSLLIMETPL